MSIIQVSNLTKTFRKTDPHTHGKLAVIHAYIQGELTADAVFQVEVFISIPPG